MSFDWNWIETKNKKNCRNKNEKKIIDVMSIYLFFWIIKSNLYLFLDDYDFDDVEGSDSESNQGVNNGNGNVIEQEIVNRVSQSESESVTSNECATDNGGCEHKCNVGQDESTGERFIECSCNEGYALDIDNKHCESK